MTFQALMSYIAFAFVMLAFIPYAAAIVREKTKPAIASWLIWGTLDYITLVAMWKQGVVNGQILGACAGVLVIVLLALYYGTAGWGKLDTFCLIGGIVGIGIWKLLDSPFIGMVTSLLVIFTASIPTFVNAWKNPGHEDKAAWFLFWLSCFPAIAGVKAWTVSDLAQPIVFLAIETTMIFILFVRPKFQSQARTA